MSLHSYTKCWLHLIWSTLRKEKMLITKDSRKLISTFLSDYCKSKGIFMKKNYVNSDHVHALIDLPTNMSIEEVIKLLKGSSSHWINQNNLSVGKFNWGRGYAALSISESVLIKVVDYIEGQEKHHKVKSFGDEYEAFLKAYGMKYVEDDL